MFSAIDFVSANEMLAFKLGQAAASHRPELVFAGEEDRALDVARPINQLAGVGAFVWFRPPALLPCPTNHLTGQVVLWPVSQDPGPLSASAGRGRLWQVA
jgi:hypothetical protein